MKKYVKKLTAAVIAVIMVMGMAVSASAENIAVCSTCGHSTQTTAIEGPYHYTYVGPCSTNANCTITKKVGILRQRCTLCGAILSESAYIIPTPIHSVC